jgi:hypothetical protein
VDNSGSSRITPSLRPEARALPIPYPGGPAQVLLRPAGEPGPGGLGGMGGMLPYDGRVLYELLHVSSPDLG